MKVDLEALERWGVRGVMIPKGLNGSGNGSGGEGGITAKGVGVDERFGVGSLEWGLKRVWEELGG